VANSRAGLDAYGLGDHPRAQVIPNGIDLSRFETVVAESRDEPTVCMLANFRALKDHATVIRALPQIRRAVPGARLILVGRDFGTLADNQQLAQRLGVSEAVRFVSDTLRPESFIAASRVCVLASPSESFSNAILEYMALAKPVVATETCGDSAALIRNGESGFLVPYGSSELLAARIIALLNDPQQARVMGEAARRQVQGFTVARMVAEHEALFTRLLAPSPPIMAVRTTGQG
jgi:glycosyltransferase involved in cell wall biosynthesis